MPTPPTQLERARRAWAALVDVAALDGVQVVVRPESMLGPVGWIGILRFEDTVTATVPDEATRAVVIAALEGVAPHDAVTLDALRRRLPPIADVLGPAALFFATEPVTPDGAVETATVADLTPLLDAVDDDERSESGIDAVTSAVSVVRVGDVPVAACGHRQWPHELAHLCVLTHPAHRGRGLGRRVARHAVRRAADDDLIPQWRARVDASKAVARSIGLVELGAQLRVRLAD